MSDIVIDIDTCNAEPTNTFVTWDTWGQLKWSVRYLELGHYEARQHLYDSQANGTETNIAMAYLTVKLGIAT